MNRIDKTFERLKKKRKKAFIAFITAGDPNLKTTEELVKQFEQNGVDIVELGVPFSDPLADGPTIQASSQRALKSRVTLQKILESVRKIRRTSQIPIALMSYYNPIFHYGEENFMKQAKACGVDGIIVPDLPPEEAQNLMKAARQYDVATVFFVAPTTKASRLKRIVQASTGFVYYISLTGVTGARSVLPSTIGKHIKQIKRLTQKPVCVGFGVSTAKQVKKLSSISDGVIVGSAIVNKINSMRGDQQLIDSTSRFVKTLSKGL